jgi:putative FmdB family regulatory protein
MPIYEYLCDDCGSKFEKLVRSSQASAEVECPPVERLTSSNSSPRLRRMPTDRLMSVVLRGRPRFVPLRHVRDARPVRPQLDRLLFFDKPLGSRQKPSNFQWDQRPPKPHRARPRRARQGCA